MVKLMLSRSRFMSLIRRRRAMGGDRYDEVWDGVYVVSPNADNEHMDFVGGLTIGLAHILGANFAGRILPGCNVSDQEVKWRRNYRVPDCAVFLPGNRAEDRGSHFLGGPDFTIEVVSRGDRSRKKLEFYASVGVKELLLVDRRPWRLELYRIEGTHLAKVDTSTPDDGHALMSEVLNIGFRMLPGQKRPRIEMTSADGQVTWLA